MKTNQKASLTFNNTYSITGVLKDGKGNIFTVYISGSKKEVDKFVRYQKRQLSKNGTPGISATVQHYDPPKVNNKTKKSTLDTSSKKRETEIEFGKVKIGISRRKIVVPPPYEITYHIDPRIKTPPMIANMGEKPKIAIPDFAIEFDDVPTATIDCLVITGMVEFKLIETDTERVADGPIIIEKDNSGKLFANASGNVQKWRVEVTGKRPGKESVFELVYSKKFSG